MIKYPNTLDIFIGPNSEKKTLLLKVIDNMLNLSGVLAREDEVDEAHNYRIQSNKIRNIQITLAGCALTIFAYHYEEFRSLRESNVIFSIVVKNLRTDNFNEKWEQSGSRQDISDPQFWCFKLFKREQFTATTFFFICTCCKETFT